MWLDTFDQSIQITTSTAQLIETPIDETDYQEAWADRFQDWLPIQSYVLSDEGDGNEGTITHKNLGLDHRQWLNMPDELGNEYELTVNTRIRDKRQMVIHGELIIPEGKELIIEEGAELIILSDDDRGGEITITGDYNMNGNEDFIYCDSTSGTITVTMPLLANVLGQEYHIKRLGANNVTIDGNGSDIDSASSQTMTSDNTALHLRGMLDNSEWRIQ